MDQKYSKIIKIPYSRFVNKMHTIYRSFFKKPKVVNELRRLHDNFVLVQIEHCIFVKITTCIMNVY
jgi:hypothetical protein